jgi:hypothetical protein
MWGKETDDDDDKPHLAFRISDRIARETKKETDDTRHTHTHAPWTITAPNNPTPRHTTQTTPPPPQGILCGHLSTYLPAVRPPCCCCCSRRRRRP